MHYDRHMKSSTFETKSLHSRNSDGDHSILDMSDLIDSNVDLFMYLIEGSRFGTWKDRCLNCALVFDVIFVALVSI